MLYKRAEVIMLPTKDRYGAIEKDPTLSGGLTIESIKYVHKNPQHLCFTTDDKIEEGDLFIRKIGTSLGIEQYIKDDHLYSGDKKVVATSDESLGLPQSPQTFIEVYCEVGGIDEVLLEYNDTEWYNERFGGTWQPFPDGKTKTRRTLIKVDSHNTITIHPIKDSLSIKEAKEIAKKAYNEGVTSVGFSAIQFGGWFDKWFDKKIYNG